MPRLWALTALLVAPLLSAAGDAYRISVVRRLWEERPDQKTQSETRFVTTLLAEAERFHEKLTIERWRNGRKENEQRFVVASDGKLRRSYPEAVNQQGKRRGVVDFSSKRSLATLPFDPLWLTDSSPLLSAARDESRLEAVLPPGVAKDVGAASASKEVVVVREFGAPARRWKSIFRHRDVPSVLQEFDGDRLARRIEVTAFGATNSGASPRITKVVRETFLPTQGAKRHTFVEAQVTAFEVSPQLDAAAFALSFPDNALVEDRTKPIGGSPAASTGS